MQMTACELTLAEHTKSQQLESGMGAFTAAFGQHDEKVAAAANAQVLCCLN